MVRLQFRADVGADVRADVRAHVRADGHPHAGADGGGRDLQSAWLLLRCTGKSIIFEVLDSFELQS